MPLLIAICFLLLTFVSAELSVATFYVLIFNLTLSRPQWQGIATIFLTSILLDVHTSLELGVSFLRFSFFYLLTNRFRMTILNSQIVIGTYYFLLLVCTTELTYCGITFICAGVFDLRRYVYQITLAMTLWITHQFVMYAAGKFREYRSA
jgi:cell shape-determining protein MreD